MFLELAHAGLEQVDENRGLNQSIECPRRKLICQSTPSFRE